MAHAAFPQRELLIDAEVGGPCEQAREQGVEQGALLPAPARDADARDTLFPYVKRLLAQRVKALRRLIVDIGPGVCHAHKGDAHAKLKLACAERRVDAAPLPGRARAAVHAARIGKEHAPRRTVKPRKEADRVGEAMAPAADKIAPAAKFAGAHLLDIAADARPRCVDRDMTRTRRMLAGERPFRLDDGGGVDKNIRLLPLREGEAVHARMLRACQFQPDAGARTRAVIARLRLLACQLHIGRAHGGRAGIGGHADIAVAPGAACSADMQVADAFHGAPALIAARVLRINGVRPKARHRVWKIRTAEKIAGRIRAEKRVDLTCAGVLFHIILLFLPCRRHIGRRPSLSTVQPSSGKPGCAVSQPSKPAAIIAAASSRLPLPGR